MREILFKAKRCNDGEWVYGYVTKHPSAIQVGESCPWYLYQPPVDPDDNGGIFAIYPDTICQYTGLTDKNGVKIFESDILAYRYITIKGINMEKEYVVQWVDNGFHLSSNDGGIDFWPKSFEVIGNIHD